MAKSGSQKRRREAEAAQEQAASAAPAGSQSAHPSKKARVEERRSLFVRSLPQNVTDEKLSEFFSQHFPVKHATVVLDNTTKVSRGYGFVTFTDAEDAAQAKEKLNNALLDGRRLKLDIAEPRTRAAPRAGSAPVPSKVSEAKRKREQEQEEARKPPKLIIRNLPWSIKHSDQLSDLFRSFGKVKFADVPSSKGKLAGFGFVTLRGRTNAEKAMEALNGKVIDGRTIAVDWAVDKDTWKQQQDGEERPTSETPQKKSKGERAKETKSAEPSKAGAKKSADDFDADEDLKNFMESHMDDLEEEDISDDEDDEAADEDEDDEDGGVDLEDDGSDDWEEEEPDSKKTKQQSDDNSSTVFVRNLPFTTTDEQLREFFTHFGPVRYARVVMDRATEKSTGKGFVCFFKVEDADSCVRGAPRSRPAATLTKQSVLQDDAVDTEGKYTIEGRVLRVSNAVSKDEASRLTSEAADARSALEKDRRRLFLLSEGQIPSNSPLYSLIPAAEIQLREDSAKQRRKMIESNPSLHLSLTRLALRNLPRNMTTKDLKALAREAVVEFAKDVKQGKRQPLSKEESYRGGQQDRESEHRRKEKRKGIVQQAKIVFESKDGSKVPEAKGGGGAVAGAKSRGYGFIEYSSHRWALMGLRWLNGHAMDNASSTKKTSRLIAEFAIENANVVARRKATEEKFRGRGPQQPTGDGQQSKADVHVDSKEKTKKKGKKKTNAPDGDAHSPASKGKAAKRGSAKADDLNVDGPDKKAAKSAEAKLAMRQRIIGRKRLMRKKKAVSRGGK